jgi:hypothetical protein
MQLHPTLSRQLTLVRQHEAHAAAEHARRIRSTRCAPPPPNDQRRIPLLGRGCEDPVPA